MRVGNYDYRRASPRKLILNFELLIINLFHFTLTTVTEYGATES